MGPGNGGACAPLSAERLRQALCVPGALWTDIRVTSQTGSTNADVLGLAGHGAPEGLVIATETQTAGRGRLGRSWQSIPGAALTFSVLLRPVTVPRAAMGWIPLLAGVATVAALGSAGVAARLKWPNDVLVGDRKLAGILAEQSGDAAVVGIGLNVLGEEADLPVPTATSLELHGAGATDRNALLSGILREAGHWYADWSAAAGDAQACGLRPAYLRVSATLGRQVRVQLPGGAVLAGAAHDVDSAGQLVVRTAHGDLVAVSAGDVVHVR